MRLRDIGISLRDEKKVLRNGMILLGFAALLVLILMKIDQVWGAIVTAVATVAPVFYGIVLAYILNVFVHFFEDIAFKPFEKSKSKAWQRVAARLGGHLGLCGGSLGDCVHRLLYHPGPH